MLKLSRRAALLAALVPAAARAQALATLSFWHNHPEWKDRVVAILARFEAENPAICIAYVLMTRQFVAGMTAGAVKG